MSRLPDSQVCALYGIRDKRDGLFRWVGRTSAPLGRRLSYHATDPAGALHGWILEAGRENVEVVPLGEADKEGEVEAIRSHAEAGHPLLNRQHHLGWERTKRPREGVLRDRLCR